jgi:hypothetical protein
MSKLIQSLVAVTMLTGASAVYAHSADPSHAVAGRHRVAIEYHDLSGTQDLSSAPFVSHGPGFHLWTVGKPASLLIQELAENGNPEFVLGTAVGDPRTFLAEAVGLPNLPGKGRRIELTVDAAHPMVSGGWMLGHTNDGFTGIESVDVYRLNKPLTIEVYPLDAGTEQNTETAADVAALGGLGRIAENGVVGRHSGIRGDADISASFKFDPAQPIGQVTITPLK